MRNFIYLIIFLTIFLCTRAKRCSKAGKIADLVFQYSIRSPNVINRVETTAYIISQSEIDHMYFLTGNQTNTSTLYVSRIRCMRLRINNYDCTRTFQSPYVSLNRIIEEGCVIELSSKHNTIKSMLYSLSLDQFYREIKLMCTITRIYEAMKPYDDNSFATTSLVTVILLSSCAALTCVVCFGWFGFSSFRRFRQRRIKVQEQKALARSVQAILDKSPVIIFDSKIKHQDLRDDDPVCAICLETFNDNEKLRKLICSHYFHVICIDPWLLSHQSCPLCNQNILNEPIQTISGRLTLSNDESTDPPIVAS